MDTLLAQRLEQLRVAQRLRDPAEPLRQRAERAAASLGQPLLRAASNDYLGFAGTPLIDSRTPGGPGGSRLVHATHPEHEAFEAELAAWLGTESALLFTSGYAANVGVLSALAQAGDRIISDRLNHASIIDGCRLSRAQLHVVPHRNLSAVETLLGQPWHGHTWLVTEAYFSMDGDSPDLARLRALANQHRASLIVDEAHSLGTFGPRGTGLCAQLGVQPDVCIGTLGKAFGLQGAFVAGSSVLRHWLWNAARSFVFSTATSPALAKAGRSRLTQVAAADAERQHLAELCAKLSGDLGPYRTPAGRHGPIFPLIVGAESAALELAEALADAGILAQAIRPPTVPQGSARLRLVLSAAMSLADVDRIATALHRTSL